MSNYTARTIEKEIRTVLADAGYPAADLSALKVKVNPRFRRTLGRCDSYITSDGYLNTPECIQISKLHVEKGTNEEVHQTILHECAHAIVAVETHENHNHDRIFRRTLRRIGGTDLAPSTDVSYETEPTIYKYKLTCSCCGKVVGYRQRACKVTKNAERFKTTCCKSMVLVEKGEFINE